MSVLAYGMPLGLGPMELVIILVILVLLFGATRLADIGSGLGKGIKEFRKNVQEEDKEPEQPAAPTPPAQQNQASAGATSSNGGMDTVSAVKCSNCGALNPVGAKHCNQCGTAIVATVS
jgi:sec-independent protein translocase protein TatA